MTTIGAPGPVRGSEQIDATTAAKDAKLRKVSTQLEGVFVQQMYKSMRSTVPTDGLFSGGSGEEMFTGLLDDHIAADTPQKWKHGLSESIFRQLRDAVRAQGSPLPPESNLLAPTGVDK
jgi:peptidoglycan hydrolase FlgJ